MSKYVFSETSSKGATSYAFLIKAIQVKNEHAEWNFLKQVIERDILYFTLKKSYLFF